MEATTTKFKKAKKQKRIGSLEYLQRRIQEVTKNLETATNDNNVKKLQEKLKHYAKQCKEITNTAFYMEELYKQYGE